MKTLIIYETKHGATEQIARSLAQRLPEAVLCNLKKEGAPDLTGYDCIVLGGPLTAGQVPKSLKAFAQQHEAVLKKRRLGLFVSGLQPEEEARYLEDNFPGLLAGAKAKRFLGGIFDPKKCGFLERTMMKAAAKLTEYTSTITDDRLDLFVRELSD